MQFAMFSGKKFRVLGSSLDSIEKVCSTEAVVNWQCCSRPFTSGAICRRFMDIRALKNVSKVGRNVNFYKYTTIA